MATTRTGRTYRADRLVVPPVDTTFDSLSQRPRAEGKALRLFWLHERKRLENPTGGWERAGEGSVCLPRFHVCVHFVRGGLHTIA